MVVRLFGRLVARPFDGLVIRRLVVWWFGGLVSLLFGCFPVTAIFAIFVVVCCLRRAAGIGIVYWVDPHRHG